MPPTTTGTELSNGLFRPEALQREPFAYKTTIKLSNCHLDHYQIQCNRFNYLCGEVRTRYLRMALSMRLLWTRNMTLIGILTGTRLDRRPCPPNVRTPGSLRNSLRTVETESPHITAMSLTLKDSSTTGPSPIEMSHGHPMNKRVLSAHPSEPTTEHNSH